MIESDLNKVVSLLTSIQIDVRLNRAMLLKILADNESDEKIRETYITQRVYVLNQLEEAVNTIKDDE